MFLIAGICETQTYSVLTGLMGIGFILYGVGAGNLASAAVGATMMSAVTAQYGRDVEAKVDEEKLRSSPANVLVTARDLLHQRQH